MIKPVTSIDTNKTNTSETYKDPLNRPLPVIMSYSSEIGTAISEIAPKLGAALWAPTFMYLGADIYDKYKNDKNNNYNPSTKRALKRTIYQGLTSIVAMPAVIIAGQCIVSPLGKLDKSGISGNSKDAIYKHIKNVIDQAHSSALDNCENFKKLITQTLENKIKVRNNEKRTTNIFKRFYNKYFTDRYDLISSDKTKVIKFAEKNAEKTFLIKNALKHGHEKHIPSKVLRTYNTILPVMKEMYKDGDYSYQATRNALKEYQNSLIFKNKLLKTLGGLATLILLANPINLFVEKQLMKKYISPGIDQISNSFVNDSHMKRIFNDMKDRITTPEDKNAKTLPLIQKAEIQPELKSKAEGSQSHTDHQQTSQSL